MANKLKILANLVRWPNLVFVAITQAFFHFCIIKTSSYARSSLAPLSDHPGLFWLLVSTSLLIAAGGYVINDYFDVNIDRINKPGRLIIDRHFSRRTGIWMHAVLTSVGLFISAYLSYRLQNPLILFGNAAASILLWVYSTTYKRKMLLGNIIVSALTAWVVLVVLIAELPLDWQQNLNGDASLGFSVARLIRIALLYAGFAFMLSLIREVVKDMEDIAGDRDDGCRTLPIRFGMNAARVFAGNWLVMLCVLVVITLIYVLQFRWYLFSIYLAFPVIFMMVVAFLRLFRARDTNDYHKLSSYLKWIMLAGISSMLFFLIYSNA